MSNVERRRQPQALSVVAEERGPTPSPPRLRLDKGRGLVSRGPGPDNLPWPVSAFVGRRHDLKQVADLVRSWPLVTITGHSGIGKTRLAIEAARRLAPAPPDGRWMVDLTRVEPTADPERVAEAIASVLDIRTEPGRSCTESIVDRIRGLEMLVVIDNCEHLAGAAAIVAGALLSSCPRLSILATSQGPLGLPGENVWPLGPLSLPAHGRPGAESDAVALFYTRAKSVNPGFFATLDGAGAVADICLRLDGIPLAIELAAVRTTVLSPIEIAELLDERFHLLGGDGRATVARHRSLQAALDWSWELLTPPEQALLRRLSLFTGGAGLGDVQAVCVGGDVERKAVIDLLAALVSKSFVVADTARARARYRLLETVRAYGRDRLQEADEEEDFVELHAHWYLELAEDGWHRLVARNDQDAADALQAEHDNLRAAVAWFLSQGDGTSALRMGCALTPFWKARGHLREGRSSLERALTLGTGAPTSMRALGLWGTGMLSLLQGDLGRATSALQESLALASAHGYERPAMEAANLLAFVAVFTDDPVTALPLLEETVGRARGRNDPGALLTVLALCGRAHLFSGDTEAARATFLECRELGRSPGVGREGEALVGLAWVALSQGRHGEAARLLTETACVGRRSVDPFLTALVLSFEGELAWRRRAYAEARASLEEGVSLARSIGAPFPLSRCLLRLGQVAHGEGDPVVAASLMEEAEDGARRAVLPQAVVRCLLARADLDRATGDVGGATARLQEALAIAADKGDPMGRSSALRRLGTLARMGGDYQAATSRYLEALELAIPCANVGAIATILEGLAGTAVARDRPERGVRLLGAAHGLRLRAGVLRSPLEAAEHEADAALVRSAIAPAEWEHAFREGSTLSLEDALALAARGRGGRKRPSSGWASLTAAERQVVDLVSEGCSNPEVAERMFISPRTVQGHLTRAFRKVGVRSRRELREAVRQQ